MDVMIESTQAFEQDLGKLSDQEKAVTVHEINACSSLFPTQKANVYDRLYSSPLAIDLNGYESSLYALQVSPDLGIVLTLDDDPIFEQAVLTLFRVARQDDLGRAYQDIAAALYQEILHQN
jgi:hypothetical protein